MYSVKKKILLISLGSIGERHLKNCVNLLQNAEVSVLRHNSKNPRQKPKEIFKTFYNIHNSLEYNPDLVIVSSPASTHLKYIFPFLKRDKYLFVEKPLSQNSSNFNQLVKQIKKSIQIFL